LGILFDYVSIKYKCVDIEISKIEDLKRFSEKIDYYEANPEEAYNDYLTAFNLKPASKIYDLSGGVGEIAVIYPRGKENNLLTLTCFMEDSSGIRYMIITHNLEQPLIVIRFSETTQPRGVEQQINELKKRLEILKKRYDELYSRIKQLTEKELSELDRLETEIATLNMKILELEAKKTRPVKTRTGYIALVY